MAFVPRSGQWCLFHLPDDRAAVVRALGAWETVHGFFVSKFARGGKDATGEFAPDRLMIVKKDGTNVYTVEEDKDGNPKIVNVFFAPDSPSVLDLQPMTDKAHFPPGYVGNTSEHPKP